MRPVLLLPLLALLAGCAVGGDDDPSQTPRRNLAVRPGAVPSDLPSAPVPTPSGSAPSPGVPSGTSGQASAPPNPTASSSSGSTAGPGAGGGSSESPFHVVGATTDFSHDADPSAPGYADMTAVTIEDNGDEARVTVDVDGSLPTQLADGEVMGIGVDLYRQGNAGRESDWQLFADGESTGWYAYLQTTRGFVRYPGTFALGGNRVVFTVPWSSLGGSRSGTFTAFVDWTRRSSSVTGNDGSNDFAPLAGRATYSR